LKKCGKLKIVPLLEGELGRQVSEMVQLELGF